MDRTTTVTVTRERVWTMTAVSVALFILLSWIFEEGRFTPPLWNGENWVRSPVITYLMILVIVLAGWYEARGIPAAGIPLRLQMEWATPGQISDPPRWRLLMGNIYFALLWLPLRFYVGREWFASGLNKFGDPGWMNGGESLKSFWERAVAIPESGTPRILEEHGWYRQFLQYMLDNGWYTWFAKVIAWGESLVGLGLILGGLVGLAAFFGTLMNFSYMLAGSASSNPVLFGLGVLLVLAWKAAGHWGLDRWILPALGTPWARAQAQVETVSERAQQEPDNTGVRGLP
jgi:thiosulfate dehydrogenase [quinone] large subunit